MIIYFSGLGNTALVAKSLAQELGDEELVTMNTEMLLHPEDFTLTSSNGKIIWAFPIYCWGIPPVVSNFMRNVKLSPEAVRAEHYMVATCGDDIGYCDRMWRKEMMARGLNAVTALSMAMPNTYVFLPGFDVDSKSVEEGKLMEAPSELTKIAKAIQQKGKHDILVRKGFSGIKTYVLFPLFKKFAFSTKPFRATDACIGCATCANSCPMANIRMVGKRPEWRDNCAMCSRCYHICPVHAVEYGSATKGKGQYKTELKQLFS